MWPQVRTTYRIEPSSNRTAVLFEGAIVLLHRVPRTAVGGVASVASAGASLVTNPLTAVKHGTGYYHIKRAAYTSLQSAFESRMLRVWQTRLKYTITADPRTPWLIRTAIHEIADAVWLNGTSVPLRGPPPSTLENPACGGPLMGHSCATP